MSENVLVIRVSKGIDRVRSIVYLLNKDGLDLSMEIFCFIFHQITPLCDKG